MNELAEVIHTSVRAFQSDAAEALEDHLHSLNGEHLGGNSLAVRGQERLGSVDQSIDSGCCERLVRQGLEQIRNQANLVRDDVVGNQAELGIAAGQLAVGAKAALVLIPREAGWSFALSSETEDVRPMTKALCAAFGGKGGGPKDMTQGVLSSGTEAEIRASLKE